MPNNDDQLQQQYQEILNKYASSLGQTPTESPPVVSPVTPEPLVVEPAPPVEMAPEPWSEPKPEAPVSSPISDPTKTIPTPTPASIAPPVAPIYFPPTPPADKPSPLFKYLFYFSIIVFVAVVVAVVYNFSGRQQSLTPQDENPTPTTTSTGQFCEFNDQKVAVGDSVPSQDSCNTCTCGSDLTMACTEKACVSAEPTERPVGKVYKDTKYGYQFECPIAAKYALEATSVNGNKIPFKQESCTDGESVATVSVYDNTIVHSFADLQTKVSPDDKYIVTFEGDTEYVFSSFQFL